MFFSFTDYISSIVNCNTVFKIININKVISGKL